MKTENTQHTAKTNPKMSLTVQDQIAKITADFRELAPAYQGALRRKAYRLTIERPYMADDNGFWRGLSARHVLVAAAK
jgi:hypothetical protein